MATLVAPSRPNRILPSKPKRGARAMTIAAAFFCGDSLIMAADNLYSNGQRKYYKPKYEIANLGLMDAGFMFAGDPGIFNEVHQRMLKELGDGGEHSGDAEGVRNALDVGLTQVRNRNLTAPDLSMFVGVCEVFSKPELVVYSGEGAYVAAKVPHVIGSGDTSLADFLATHLWWPEMSELEGIAVAAYIIKKATEHIAFCEEPIDVLVVNNEGIKHYGTKETAPLIQKMEGQQEFLATLLVKTPFQL